MKNIKEQLIHNLREYSGSETVVLFNETTQNKSTANENSCTIAKAIRPQTCSLLINIIEDNEWPIEIITEGIPNDGFLHRASRIIINDMYLIKARRQEKLPNGDANDGILNIHHNFSVVECINEVNNNETSLAIRLSNIINLFWDSPDEFECVDERCLRAIYEQRHQS